MSAPDQAAGKQFHVTHCPAADNLHGTAGFGVCAASTAETGAIREALEYPPYELPIDLWKEKPAPTHAPRRLARTVHPRGGVWVAHSVYLERDSAGRPRSYFTHLLHLPESAAGPASVLESWDADGWAREHPPGSARALPVARVPVGSAISTRKLIPFLSLPKTGATDLSFVVCPTRFQTDLPARRNLIARFLHAVTLAAGAKQTGGTRDRLFVHGEPGLVAMLLYAAVRILPPQFTADLTFSTFEPAHRAIRDFKLATVVGTYLGVPGKGLDPELATRAFALDTLAPERSSPELAGRVCAPDGITRLIELAAEGRWDVLARVHHQAGTDTGAVARIPEVVRSLLAPRVSKPHLPTPAAHEHTSSSRSAPATSPSPPPSAPEPPHAEPAHSPSSAPPIALRGRAIEKLLWPGVVAVGVLLVGAIVGIALWHPNRNRDQAKVEPPPAGGMSDGPVSPPTTPPDTRPAVIAKPKKAASSGSVETPVVAPDPEELAVAPPPRAAGAGLAVVLPPEEDEAGAILTETVGLLASLQLYQSYLNIGLLADLRTRSSLKPADLAQLLDSVVAPLDQVDKELQKTAGLKGVNDEDVAAIARLRKTANLLREQGKALQAFWDTGLEAHTKKYDAARLAAWKELEDLLELDPAKAPAPTPPGKKP